MFRTLIQATIIPEGKIKGSIRTVNYCETEIDEISLAKSLIIYAVAGKAAESLNRGTSTSAAYSFLKNTRKTDYKIADAFAEKICCDPPMKTLLFWIENFAKIFQKNAKAPIFFGIKL